MCEFVCLISVPAQDGVVLLPLTAVRQDFQTKGLEVKVIIVNICHCDL